jgi:transposase
MRDWRVHNEDEKKEAGKRYLMVAAVREGESLREVARRFRVSPATVYFWVSKAEGRRLDRVDWEGLSPGCRPAANRTPAAVEAEVMRTRKRLGKTILGECGAHAIVHDFEERGLEVPTVRTVGRILARQGAVTWQGRRRWPSPPRGWYLPDLAAGAAELDSADVVEGLSVGGRDFDVLNLISFHGGLPNSWAMPNTRAKTIFPCFLEHWRKVGLPRYAQFDNDLRFQGPHNHPDVFSRIVRLCLELGVTAVFAPPREMGFQAAIEQYNGQWQKRVWGRRTYRSLKEVQVYSARYVEALRQHRASRIESAPARHRIPADWQCNLQQVVPGTVIFIRRTSDKGTVSLLEKTYQVDPQWVHRLVRCEMRLHEERIQFFALRRRAPEEQPLLNEVHYLPPKNGFWE